jgi:hypothetical protein
MHNIINLRILSTGLEGKFFHTKAHRTIGLRHKGLCVISKLDILPVFPPKTKKNIMKSVRLTDLAPSSVPLCEKFQKIFSRLQGGKSK